MEGVAKGVADGVARGVALLIAKHEAPDRETGV